MGLCIEAEDYEDGINTEIRRESIILGPSGPDTKQDAFSCNHSDLYGWYVEVDKTYLKKIIKFFTENPKHLETK